LILLTTSIRVSSLFGVNPDSTFHQSAGPELDSGFSGVSSSVPSLEPKKSDSSTSKVVTE
jgi:hypothetical protein